MGQWVGSRGWGRGRGELNIRAKSTQSFSSKLYHLVKDVPLVEFMYLVFTRMPGKSYRRRLRSLLLYLCYVFGALINSLVC